MRSLLIFTFFAAMLYDTFGTEDWYGVLFLSLPRFVWKPVRFENEDEKMKKLCFFLFDDYEVVKPFSFFFVPSTIFCCMFTSFSQQ